MLCKLRYVFLVALAAVLLGAASASALEHVRYNLNGSVVTGPVYIDDPSEARILVGEDGTSTVRAILRSDIVTDPPPDPDPEPSPMVVFDADASDPFGLEWASGNARDVRNGEGTLGNNSLFTTTTRIARVTDPVPPAGHAMAWRTTVLAGDRDYYSSGNQRTEMGMNSPSRTMPDGIDRNMREGETRFIAYNMYIPSSYPNVSAWAAFNQNKCDSGGGNGPLSMGFWNGRLNMGKSASQTYGSTNAPIVWESPLRTTRDAWLKILIEVKWSRGADGYYALHGDLADGLGFRTLKPRTDGWTLKASPCDRVGTRVGIYRQAVNVDSSLYFSGLNIATTREDATKFAFGSSM